jgi:hypothetical protein
VFKHHHEEATGRTSSIGQHNLCLDSQGNILNDQQFRNTTCGEYVKHASKIITLVDLAGGLSPAGPWLHMLEQHACHTSPPFTPLPHRTKLVCLVQGTAVPHHLCMCSVRW